MPFSLTVWILKDGSSFEKEMACLGILKGAQVEQAIGCDGADGRVMSANGLHLASVFE